MKEPIEIPDFQTLMLPLLRLGESATVQLGDAVTKLIEQFNLTEEQKNHLLPSGSATTIGNRTAWAVTFLVKAKLLNRPSRGHFRITERGKSVLKNPPDRITVKFLEQYPEFLEFRNKGKNQADSISTDNKSYSEELSTPEERIENAYLEITEALKDEILTKVLESSTTFFEKLIVKLLVSMGYGGSSKDAGRHIGKSGDEGVDGVIDEDKLGLDVIYIQAKRYDPKRTVSRPDIQQFAGSLMGKGANKGVFVTTSSFSNQAIDYSERVQQRLILIDGQRLVGLMLENNVGVRLNRQIELKKIDEDFFIE